MDITYPVTSDRQRVRDALVEFGMYREWTHWVTLNTHRDLSIDTAYRRLTRWRVEMLRCLHGHRFFELPEDERFGYFGAPHHVACAAPHFHLACFVPDMLINKFLRLAPRRWIAIVPSGTFHVEPIDDDPGSPRRVLGYALRQFDPRHALAFVDSRIYL